MPSALVGCKNFKRQNPRSDRFPILGFHHIEFWCGDASTTASRFSWGLGLPLVAKSDLSTGNATDCSHVLRSHDLVFAFTAPYGAPPSVEEGVPTQPSTPLPQFSRKQATDFFSKHGLAARAVAVTVKDVREAHDVSVKNGATSAMPPTVTRDRWVLCEEQHVESNMCISLCWLRGHLSSGRSSVLCKKCQEKRTTSVHGS